MEVNGTVIDTGPTIYKDVSFPAQCNYNFKQNNNQNRIATKHF